MQKGKEESFQKVRTFREIQETHELALSLAEEVELVLVQIA